MSIGYTKRRVVRLKIRGQVGCSVGRGVKLKRCVSPKVEPVVP